MEADTTKQWTRRSHVEMTLIVIYVLQIQWGQDSTKGNFWSTMKGYCTVDINDKLYVLGFYVWKVAHYDSKEEEHDDFLFCMQQWWMKLTIINMIHLLFNLQRKCCSKMGLWNWRRIGYAKNLMDVAYNSIVQVQESPVTFSSRMFETCRRIADRLSRGH